MASCIRTTCNLTAMGAACFPIQRRAGSLQLLYRLYNIRKLHIILSGPVVPRVMLPHMAWKNAACNFCKHTQ